ncbi:MAG: formylglycine-generating enzyme family protein [Pseudodesulfovibrio sp.]
MMKLIAFLSLMLILLMSNTAFSSSSSPEKTWTDPTTGMEFVWVPGGCYQMGSNSGSSEEKPVHEVCVDGFWMSKYEVTNAQYHRYKVDHINDEYRGYSLNGNNQPVVDLSWNDAKAYAKWLSDKSNGSFRLPTEAEWEYAARSGGRDEEYAGGHDVDDVAWHDSNSGNTTHPVGTKAPNGLGLYDMSGNVSEWCEDWYNENAYSSHSRKNPLYSGEGDYRVRRGGSWFHIPNYVRSASRNGSKPRNTFDDMGFRLLRTNELLPLIIHNF